jgi:multimeric flavodoxin WrbA
MNQKPPADRNLCYELDRRDALLHKSTGLFTVTGSQSGQQQESLKGAGSYRSFAQSQPFSTTVGFISKNGITHRVNEPTVTV